MATTKKYLDYDGLVQYTSLVKKAVNDGSYSHGVTDIDGTTTAPTIAGTVNATATQRSAAFTKDGTGDTFPYYDTTYDVAVAGSKDGLMSRTDKTKLDGIATGAEANVQSDWNQTTTTADDYIKNKPAVNKVKQTTKSDNHDYPVLVSAEYSPTSGTDYEAGYNTDIKYNPSTGTLKIGSANIVGSTKMFNGRASGTEGLLSQATVSTNGAEMVGYQDGDNHKNESFDGLSTVDDALNVLIETVDNMSLDGGGVIVDVDGTNLDISSGDTLDEVVGAIDNKVGDILGDITDLQDGDNLIQGTNVTLTKDTTNHTVTIAAADPTVAQTTSSENANLPVLLANGATPTTGGAKYNSAVTYNPSGNVFKISTTNHELNFFNSTITLKDKTSIPTKTATITSTEYSGNAATATLATQATQDGEGNNIVNTYATKEALSELSQKWTGQFVVVKQTGDTAEIYVALTNILEAIEAGQTPSATDLAVLEYGYIYLMRDTGASSPNIYDEYIKVKTGTTTESVEKIGTTDAGVDVVSLTTAEINTIWSTTAAAS